ncbi:MAG: hypothetical protein IJ769_04475 [Clostridia bacterium]|nr:hypothetical protein [Clostridia bacterium]
MKMMKRMISLMSAAILVLGGAAAPVGSGITPAVSADGPYAITDLYAVLTADQTDGNRATIGSFSLDEGYTETDATFTLTGLDVDFSEYDKLYYMFALPYLLKEGESMSFSAGATATITPKTAPFVDEEPASAYTVTSEPAVVKFDSSCMVLNVAFYDLQGIDLDCKIDVKLKMTDFKMTMPAPEPEAPAKTSISKAAVKAANKTYTGKALKPAPTVKLGGKTLKKGTDYTVSYKNNKNCGKATVTVADGNVTVDYKYFGNPAYVNNIPSTECVAWFTDVADITTEFLDAPESDLAFGQAVSIAEELNGQDTALLFICNRTTYSDNDYFNNGTGLARYWRNEEPWPAYRVSLKAMLDAMK